MLSSQTITGFLVAVALCAACAAASADGQIYKWVDKDGKVHYSDCPPPPDCDVEEVTKSAPEPSEKDVERARERLDKLLEEQEISAAMRKAERAVREAEELNALATAIQIKRMCALAYKNLAVLAKERPVYSTDDQGRYVYYTDEQRAAAKARFEQFTAKYCQPKK